MDVTDLFTLARKGAALLAEGRQKLETVKEAVEKNRAAYSESDLNELTKLLSIAHSDAHQAGSALDAALAKAENR